MLEFFEKNFVFLVLITIIGSFVIYSVSRDRKEAERKEKNTKELKKEGE